MKSCVICGEEIPLNQITLTGVPIPETDEEKYGLCLSCRTHVAFGKVLIVCPHSYREGRGMWSWVEIDDYPKIKKMLAKTKNLKSDIPRRVPRSRVLIVTDVELYNKISMHSLDDIEKQKVIELQKRIARQEDEIESLESELSGAQYDLESMQEELAGFLMREEIAVPNVHAEKKESTQP